MTGNWGLPSVNTTILLPMRLSEPIFAFASLWMYGCMEERILMLTDTLESGLKEIFLTVPTYSIQPDIISRLQTETSSNSALTVMVLANDLRWPPITRMMVISNPNPTRMNIPTITALLFLIVLIYCIKL